MPRAERIRRYFHLGLGVHLDAIVACLQEITVLGVTSLSLLSTHVAQKHPAVRLPQLMPTSGGLRRDQLVLKSFWGRVITNIFPHHPGFSKL